MKYDEFAREVRLTRGRLTKYDNDIRDIFLGGTKELKEFTLKKKLMGVRNIAWISTQTVKYQDKFTKWMAEKNWKAPKHELDLWFSVRIKVMLMDNQVLNKVVLFVVQDYLQRTAEETELPPILYRLKASIQGYKSFHMFSIEEATQVLEISKDAKLLAIMDKEVSFLVFAMEVMKLWTEDVDKKNRPHLNISDKHFRLGGKHFWKQMMVLKKTDSEEYEEKTEVIDTSIDVAREFYKYHKEKLC